MQTFFERVLNFYWLVDSFISPYKAKRQIDRHTETHRQMDGRADRQTEEKCWKNKKEHISTSRDSASTHLLVKTYNTPHSQKMAVYLHLYP